MLLIFHIVIGLVVSSCRFPAQLKNMLFYLSQVVNTRYPEESIFAVGTVVFLRFINPALGESTSVYEITVAREIQ